MEEFAETLEASGISFRVAGVGANKLQDFAERGVRDLTAHTDAVGCNGVSVLGVHDLQDITTRVGDLQRVVSTSLNFNRGFGDFLLQLLGHDVSKVCSSMLLS